MPRTAADDSYFPSFDSIEAVLWPAAALLIFVITAVLVDVMILLAARWRLVDLPNRRSAHALPTARGGGLAIVCTFTIGAIAVAARWPVAAVPVLLGALLPCLVVAAVGFVDDIRPLRASLRLLIQIAVAAIIAGMLGPIEAIAIAGMSGLELGSLAWPFTVVWIVGLTNAFNFMDGSDGMAATGAIVVGLSIGLLGLQLQAHVPMLLSVFLAAAAAGFLVFNWPPARIFMGDAGSGFLGTFFATLPLLFPAPARPLVFLPIVLCLWPYIYDPFLSVLRRITNGKNPFQPHREFLFHRLIRSGVSHSQAAILYGLMAAVGALAGWAMLTDGTPGWFRGVLPWTVIAAAAGLTWGIERRCASVGLLPAETGHTPKPR
jgi:UDP-N-acetylmuramyl pentapeptide phosphotransferase/UDP-N-acetylglucosamine-1-phosphate transferase